MKIEPQKAQKRTKDLDEQLKIPTGIFRRLTFVAFCAFCGRKILFAFISFQSRLDLKAIHTYLVLPICLAFSLQVWSCRLSYDRDIDQEHPPNILLIMADDMGFSDMGCYGSEIPTPNIDALAREGMRFTQFYNTGRCCPSRASLLTGKYPHSVGMGWMNAADLGHPGYTGRLHDQAYTMAEALQSAHYRTYMVGKWHLTPTASVESTDPDGSWPWQRGFDEFYGTMEGAKDYFRPSYLYRNAEARTAGVDYYYTHAIRDSAVAFILRHPKGGPFFLYAAFYTPHFPLHAPDSTVQKYRGKYREGWDRVREQRLERQKTMGLMAPDVQPADIEEEIPAWEDLPADKRDEMDLRMAIYAAQIQELDQSVGKMVAALKQSGQYDRTLIVFLSDNGALGGPTFGNGPSASLNRSGPYTSYGRAWGRVSNTPYRKYKSFCHEGGIIAPLILRHKTRITAGTINPQPTHITDLMPTLLEIAGIELPKQKNGQEALRMDGRSLWPILQDPQQDWSDRPLYWEHEGRRAVRRDHWKLVAAAIDAPWELYHLSEDPTELMDLSGQYPERVDSLDQLWRTWAASRQVLPLDGRGWNERLK